VNNEVESYVGELRELRERVKDLEVRLNLPNNKTFFYNILKKEEKRIDF